MLVLALGCSTGDPTRAPSDERLQEDTAAVQEDTGAVTLPTGDSGCDAETCAPGDEDCDGDEDEEGAVGCVDAFADADADGVGGESLGCWCEPPENTVAGGGDCDDDDPYRSDVCEARAGTVIDLAGEPARVVADGELDNTFGSPTLPFGDLDGDGADDLLAFGRWVVPIPTDTVYASQVAIADVQLSGWYLLDVMDRDHDGASELIFGTESDVGNLCEGTSTQVEIIVFEAPFALPLDEAAASLRLTFPEQCTFGVVDFEAWGLGDLDGNGQDELFAQAFAQSGVLFGGVDPDTGAVDASELRSGWGRPAGDLDGDGLDDLFRYGTSLGVTTDIADGLAGATTTTLYTPPDGSSMFGGARAGDMDGDGYGDLVALRVGGDPAGLIFAGPPVEDAEPVGEVAVGTYAEGVTGGMDLDGDGRGDIVIGGGSEERGCPSPTPAWGLYLGPVLGRLEIPEADVLWCAEAADIEDSPADLGDGRVGLTSYEYGNRTVVIAGM